MIKLKVNGKEIEAGQRLNCFGYPETGRDQCANDVFFGQ
jgi:hypothetical protein